MYKFVKYIGWVFLITTIMLICIDELYTKVFTDSPDSTRLGYVKSQQEKHFNYAFVGSSRVVNHIVPDVFEKELHSTAVNFGVMDARPKDIVTLVKLMDYWGITYDTLFVQLDYYYNSLGRSNFMYYEMLPFIDNPVIEPYYNTEKSYFSLQFIPFYRYMVNDSKLGLRSFVKEIFIEESKLTKSQGFVPLNGYGNPWERVLPNKLINEGNQYVDELIHLSKKKHLNIKFFVAPFRYDVKNVFFIDSLKKRMPGLLDFSKDIKDPKYFKNGYHLNKEGANMFSEIFANHLKR